MRKPNKVQVISFNTENQKIFQSQHRMDVASLSSATADVDLNGDSNAPLQVDISDALSEKDKVKFTVHTRSASSFCLLFVRVKKIARNQSNFPRALLFID